MNIILRNAKGMVQIEKPSARLSAAFSLRSIRGTRWVVFCGVGDSMNWSHSNLFGVFVAPGGRLSGQLRAWNLGDCLAIWSTTARRV
eukprot:3823497-Amphidinium_carterae.1